MNSLLDNFPMHSPRVNTGVVEYFGHQTLSALYKDRQASIRPTPYRNEVQAGSRAARTLWKHGGSMAVALITGGTLISQAEKLPPSAYVAAVGERVEKSFPASKDEIRYRELTQKHFVEGLSVTEQKELDAVEERLDAADEADPHLLLVSAKISDGYDHLRNELEHVNKVLDRLLAH